MIDILLKDSTQTVDLSTRTTSPIVVENQLDVSLDSGTLNYIKTELNGEELNEPLAGYTVGIGGKTFEFIGMDSRALLRKNVSGQSIYKHQVSLTEPSKLLQGVLIDGFGVSQPEEVMTVSETKTVKQDSPIQSIANMGRYAHRAEGAIKTSEKVTGILSVQGSTPNTTPTAHYDKEISEIIWNVQWYDSTPSYGNPYTVTIVFTCEYLNASTLEDVVEHLLTVNPLDGSIYSLTAENAVRAALRSVIAPEFKWNTQTTLWECLLQIGAVIDAMPRLVSNSNGNYTVVTFEFVNTYGNAVENISDQWTNADGQNVEESQYNTTLRSLVENLREN